MSILCLRKVPEVRCKGCISNFEHASGLQHVDIVRGISLGKNNWIIYIPESFGPGQAARLIAMPGQSWCGSRISRQQTFISEAHSEIQKSPHRGENVLPVSVIPSLSGTDLHWGRAGQWWWSYALCGARGTWGGIQLCLCFLCLTVLKTGTSFRTHCSFSPSVFPPTPIYSALKLGCFLTFYNHEVGCCFLNQYYFTASICHILRGSQGETMAQRKSLCSGSKCRVRFMYHLQLLHPCRVLTHSDLPYRA